MNTFMGQDNMNIESLCLQNNCELVIVLHNLTNKFQTLIQASTRKLRGFFQVELTDGAQKVSQLMGNHRVMSKSVLN